MLFSFFSIWKSQMVRKEAVIFYLGKFFLFAFNIIVFYQYLSQIFREIYKTEEKACFFIFFAPLLHNS